MTVRETDSSPTQTETAVVRRILSLGCRAPSVHNTQPWRWRVAGTRVELRADRSRQLEVGDPDARNLTISCGAALHHVQVAARGLGWTADVTRFPDAGDPDLLAIIALRPQPPATRAELELLDALDRRQTDRRRLTTWPVPEEHLDQLASIAQRWGARVLPLTGTAARSTVERLAHRAFELQANDRRLAAERERWGCTERMTPVGRSDSVLAICTAHDVPASWLDAGETLSALWLRATVDGFSLVPLSQMIEVEETRLALREDVFFGMAQPQLLVRIGWQEVNDPSTPRSQRRSLETLLI